MMIPTTTTGIVVLGSSPRSRIILSSSRLRAATAPAPAPSAAVVAEAPAEPVKQRRRPNPLPRYLPPRSAPRPRRRARETKKDDDWCPSRMHLAHSFEDLLRGGSRDSDSRDGAAKTYVEEYRTTGWDSRDEKVARESRLEAYAEAAAKRAADERERRRLLHRGERRRLVSESREEENFLVLPQKQEASSRRRVVSRVPPPSSRTSSHRRREPRPTEPPTQSRCRSSVSPSRQWQRRKEKRESTTENFIASMSELILRELRGDDDASDELKAPRVAVESHAKLMEKYSSSLMPHDDNTRTKEDDPAGSSWLAERHRELV